jgi:hypothetical protein
MHPNKKLGKYLHNPGLPDQMKKENLFKIVNFIPPENHFIFFTSTTFI